MKIDRTGKFPSDRPPTYKPNRSLGFSYAVFEPTSTCKDRVLRMLSSCVGFEGQLPAKSGTWRVQTRCSEPAVRRSSRGIGSCVGMRPTSNPTCEAKPIVAVCEYLLDLSTC